MLTNPVVPERSALQLRTALVKEASGLKEELRVKAMETLLALLFEGE